MQTRTLEPWECLCNTIVQPDNRHHRKLPHYSCCDRVYSGAQWKRHTSDTGHMGQKVEVKRPQRPGRPLEVPCALGCDEKVKWGRRSRHHSQTHVKCKECEKVVLPSKFNTHKYLIHRVENPEDSRLTYLRDATKAREDALACMNGLENLHPRSRLAIQRSEYIDILAACNTGRPISATEYPAGNWDEATDHFVLCSTEEARSVLRQRVLQLPLLILNATDHKLQVEDYLKVLESRPFLDVHDFGEELADSPVLVPRQMPSIDATALFRDRSRPPVKFLNLRGHKQNPVPSCLVGLANFTILETTHEGLENGKAVSRVPYDLSACAHFQICGKKGAFHFPHVDRGAVITTITADDGHKLWPLWPGDDMGRLREWAASDSLPNGPCVGIYLAPGSLLVQPAATIHAPYSSSDVLMTGTMHWDSRSMCRVMELSALENLYPHITNEEPAKELRHKIYHIQHLWEHGARYLSGEVGMSIYSL